MTPRRGSQSLPRSVRIRSSRDYQVIGSQGKRVAGRQFVLLERGREGIGAPVARLGITASRRVGNAVARNRIKRCVREWFRHLETRPAVDWVVIARRGASRKTSREIVQELDALRRRITQQA